MPLTLDSEGVKVDAGRRTPVPKLPAVTEDGETAEPMGDVAADGNVLALTVDSDEGPSVAMLELLEDLPSRFNWREKRLGGENSPLKAAAAAYG